MAPPKLLWDYEGLLCAGVVKRRCCPASVNTLHQQMRRREDFHGRERKDRRHGVACGDDFGNGADDGHDGVPYEVG